VVFSLFLSQVVEAILLTLEVKVSLVALVKTEEMEDPLQTFFAVFNINKEWGWSCLPPSYLESAYLSCDTTTMSGLYQEFGIWQSSTEQEAVELAEINSNTSTPQRVESAQSTNEPEQLLQLQEFTDCPEQAIHVTDEPLSCQLLAGFE